MTYYVKVNKATAEAVNAWAGHQACSGNDNRIGGNRFGLCVVNAKCLLHTGNKMTAEGKIRSLRQAKQLEATVREIAARAGVENIITEIS